MGFSLKVPKVPNVPAMASLLRSQGLEIFNNIFRKKKTPEEAKYVLRNSLWITLSRNSVHILPTTVFIALLWLNYGVIYIGPNFTEWPEKDATLSSMIQLAAKMQELLCVASLTAIVLRALRLELLGDGVPLGLLGCGTWFDKFQSLWSPDFIAAGPWSMTAWKRLRLYSLLILAGALATVIGPASAVLMIPRNQNVPAGGTSFYFNFSSDAILPAFVNGSQEPEVCGYANATKYAVCPSGGYTSLRHTLSTVNYTNFLILGPDVYDPSIQATGVTGNRKWFNLLVQSYQSFVPPVLSSVAIDGGIGFGNDTAAVQPHAATVIKMQQLVREWYNRAYLASGPGRNEYKWTYNVIATGFAWNPSVRVRCSNAQNLTANRTDALFPFLDDNSWAQDVLGIVRTYNSSITGIQRNASTHLRAQWVNLTDAERRFGDDDLGIVPSGVLIELPWNGTSRVAVGCTIAAAWHPDALSSDRTTDYDAWMVDLTWHDHAWDIDSPDDPYEHVPIEMDASWLSLLTPASPDAAADGEAWIPNTLEQILVDAGYNDAILNLRTRSQQVGPSCSWAMLNVSRTDTQLWSELDCYYQSQFRFIELILASMVADGLSRYGSHWLYNITPDLRDWTLHAPQTYNSSRLLRHLPQSPLPSDSLAHGWLTIDVVGYAYFANTVADYLATAVACIYMLLAGWHVLYVLIWRDYVSSSAWDTVTELLVLCQNSVPAVSSDLDNTSAGIDYLKTYETVVKVRATKPTEADGEARLRVVLGDDSEDEHQGAVANDADDSEAKKPSKKGVSTWWRRMNSSDSGTSTLVNLVPYTVVTATASRGFVRQRKLERVKVDVKYG